MINKLQDTLFSQNEGNNTVIINNNMHQLFVLKNIKANNYTH